MACLCRALVGPAGDSKDESGLQPAVPELSKGRGVRLPPGGGGLLGDPLTL